MTKEKDPEDLAKMEKFIAQWTSRSLDHPEQWWVVNEMASIKGNAAADTFIRAIKNKNWQESCTIFQNLDPQIVDPARDFWITFFTSKIFEKSGDTEKYHECTKTAYLLLEDQFTTALFPIAGDEDIRKILGNEYGKFPMYGFFLFSSFDQDLIAFLQEHAHWLHASSGDDVLLSVFENPEKWGQRWKEYWQKKLGPQFDEKYREWCAILPEDRDLGYTLADQLGMEKNLLPCIIFVKSYQDRQVLCVPIIQNKDNYRFYLEDLFTVIQQVKNIPEEQRFSAFQVKWKKMWMKWILPEKIKDYSAAVKEWGSLIIDTKNTLIAILEPVTPFLTPIKNILAPQG